MVITQKDREALDHLERAIDDSHELEPILKLFEKYPELERIRQRELAADGEECYGPWCGGEYYHVALGKVLEEWSSKEQSKTAEYSQKLQDECARLKEENARLRKENENIADSLLTTILRILNNSDRFGDKFAGDIQRWILNSAERIKEKQEVQE